MIENITITILIILFIIKIVFTILAFKEYEKLLSTKSDIRELKRKINNLRK